MIFLNIDEFESKDKIYLNKAVYNPIIKIHKHNFLEIVYICDGVAEHVVNGICHPAKRGSLFFLNFNIEHIFIHTSSNFTILNLVFLPSVIDEKLECSEDLGELFNLGIFTVFPKENIDYKDCILLRDCMGKIESLLYMMNEEYLNKKLGYHAVLQHSLIALLTNIFRMASGKAEESQNSRNKKLINEIIVYISQNLQRSLSLNEIAACCNLSPSYFSAVFKSVMGYSLFEYIHRVRVSEACRQLSETNKGISDIMSDVGYCDAKYFYKIFRQYTNKTPGEYRRLNEGKSS